MFERNGNPTLNIKQVINLYSFSKEQEECELDDQIGYQVKRISVQIFLFSYIYRIKYDNYLSIVIKYNKIQ